MAKTKHVLENNLQTALKTNLELVQRIIILEKRCLHADIETAQARVSRDSWKLKYEALAPVKEEECLST